MDSLIENFFLLDVVPLNLGTDVQSGEMDIIVKKNTSIPIQKSKGYATASDNQKSISFKVFEGERVMAADNHKLGEIVLHDLEKAPKGELKFEAIFRIDENGILYVTAIDKQTGN